MLDENLPTFLLKASSDKPKQHSTFLYSQHGSEFEPAYTLRHLDPEQPGSRNRYDVAIYDAFNPDVVFAEVLLIPNWTQPTLSQEDIRRNAGITPAPEPILPLEFTIQLYNPDQQILVKHKPASLTSAATWDFEMPQQSFRTPSHSQLDRSQDDPALSEFTSKLALRWKKDGRFGKDLGCYLSGRALNPDGTRNKHKEPDITIAILKDLKEVTFYEPNMARVELEDLKGFEVALLLGAVVIRDVYFGSMKETFHLASGRSRSGTSPVLATPTPVTPQALTLTKTASPQQVDRIPPTDPRSQWEIEQETARLRREAAGEAAEQDRQRRKREEAEERQIRKMLEEEDRERRRKAAEVDLETERLRRMYGQPSDVPVLHVPQPYHRHSQSGPPDQLGYGYQQSGSEQYLAGSGYQADYLQPERPKEKTSFFGFRRNSDQDNNKVAKKKSTLW